MPSVCDRPTRPCPLSSRAWHHVAVGRGVSKAIAVAASPRQEFASGVRCALVDMAYSELPGDVEIVENDEGRFGPRSSEREVPSGVRQATPELACLVCLTYLNVWAAMARAGAALGGTSRYPPSRYTRAQYERACAELGVVRLPDSVCESLERKRFEAPKHDAETIVISQLAMNRRAGIEDERRLQCRAFEEDLNHLPWFRGLSREQYEQTCTWIGAEPAEEEQITELKVECFQQEELDGMADLPLILAKWRETGRMHERREGA
jgi:hypothetical protein